MADRVLIWSIHETAGVDTAWVSSEARRLSVEGRVAGQRPRPYLLTYRLETNDDWVHGRMEVEARWPDGSAHLDLRRVDDSWTENGVPRPDLDAALDCDLGACPMTNTMPVLRHRLHERAGDIEFLMAFIEVPDLRVVPSTQRYTHLHARPDGGAVVRYRSGSFESELTIDADGFVVDYPQLGRRIEAASASAPDVRASGPGSVRPG